MREIERRTYFIQGDFEINFSTSIGVGFLTMSNTIIDNYSTDPNSYEYSSRPFVFIISGSFGVCVIDGLSAESEFDMNFIGDSDISTSIILNASYHFNLPRKRTFPFIKLGYGWSNYFPGSSYNYQNNAKGSSFDTRVFNAGAGLKIIYSSDTVMKMELNYKRYTSSYSSSYVDPYYNQSSTTDTDIDALTFSIGFSILI